MDYDVIIHIGEKPNFKEFISISYVVDPNILMKHFLLKISRKKMENL